MYTDEKTKLIIEKHFKQRADDAMLDELGAVLKRWDGHIAASLKGEVFVFRGSDIIYVGTDVYGDDLTP